MRRVGRFLNFLETRSLISSAVTLSDLPSTSFMLQLVGHMNLRTAALSGHRRKAPAIRSMHALRQAGHAVQRRWTDPAVRPVVLANPSKALTPHPAPLPPVRAAGELQGTHLPAVHIVVHTVGTQKAQQRQTVDRRKPRELGVSDGCLSDIDRSTTSDRRQRNPPSVPQFSQLLNLPRLQRLAGGGNGKASELCRCGRASVRWDAAENPHAERCG